MTFFSLMVILLCLKVLEGKFVDKEPMEKFVLRLRRLNYEFVVS